MKPLDYSALMAKALGRPAMDITVYPSLCEDEFKERAAKAEVRAEMQEPNPKG